MTIKKFQQLNVARCFSKEACKSWGETYKRTLTDWALCLVGEAGELCNEVKKGSLYTIHPANKHKVIAEACDVITYAFLLLNYLECDVETELVKKFDEVSERIGWKQKLPTIAKPEEIRELHDRGSITRGPFLTSALTENDLQIFATRMEWLVPTKAFTFRLPLPFANLGEPCYYIRDIRVLVQFDAELGEKVTRLELGYTFELPTGKE